MSEGVVVGRTVVLVEELGEEVGEGLIGEGPTQHHVAAGARHPGMARILGVGHRGLD